MEIIGRYYATQFSTTTQFSIFTTRFSVFAARACAPNVSRLAGYLVTSLRESIFSHWVFNLCLYPIIICPVLATFKLLKLI